ncbi:hypothetical protein SAMN05428642_1011324 [Flaviramulus basaltis]|uniref:Uncharacterized protein n=1 Tax=Flaviramulus basaltis TaxID=369401 RepID=A0A1K2IEZ6_9FLAO|nr:hypothetical protein [Flaviramulus basaltis]SFZ90996.1 hypothetical protein SAMN05428642_1011324 [Flaviramulus basaltis]
MQNKRFISILVFATIILLIPLIAMQFSKQVKWSLSDFITAGALLYGTSLFYELILKKVLKKEYRIILTVAIIITLLFIWLELSVGIFGTPIAGN